MNLSRANDVLRLAVAQLAEGDDKVNGKSGVWRTVRGRKIFFPDDGSDPIGMPGAMKRKKKGGGIKGFKKKTGESKIKARAKIKRKIDAQIAAAGGGEAVMRKPKERKKAVQAAKPELDDAASGSGGDAVEALGKDDETKDALDKLDNGKPMDDGEKKKLVSGGVRKAVAGGLGTALMALFPGVMAHALLIALGKMAFQAAGKKLASIFEAKTSRRERLADAIEGGIKDSIARLASGDVDEKLMSRALQQAKKKRGQRRAGD